MRKVKPNLISYFNWWPFPDIYQYAIKDFLHFEFGFTSCELLIKFGLNFL